MVHRDQGLRHLLHLEHLPSTDAAGDWLRRTGAGKGLAGLDRVNRRIVARRLRQLNRREYTLDIDATQIVAEKRDAAWTYKGERGYMPMVGHLVEAGYTLPYPSSALGNGRIWDGQRACRFVYFVYTNTT